jgi:CO/xanthine dehydrogenase Mo-binding subunit
VVWLRDTRRNLRDFPQAVRRDMGALFATQCGETAEHVKPFKGVGSCVKEIAEGYATAATLYASQKADAEVTVRGGRRLASVYRCPAIDIETYCAYTNQVPCTQTRTPGSPQVVFALESQADIIAKEMGIDPLEFRRRNIIGDGEVSPLGEKWHRRSGCIAVSAECQVRGRFVR